MNDFTKDELLAMLNIIKYKAKLDDDIHEYLAAKIEPMIENYNTCKHKTDGLVYFSNPPQYKCLECGRYYCKGCVNM